MTHIWIAVFILVLPGTLFNPEQLQQKYHNLHHFLNKDDCLDYASKVKEKYPIFLYYCVEGNIK